jgi:L-amino acid N-acyltransferase YncA
LQIIRLRRFDQRQQARRSRREKNIGEQATHQAMLLLQDFKQRPLEGIELTGPQPPAVGETITRATFKSLSTTRSLLQIRPYKAAITEVEGRVAWVDQSQAVLVALDEDGAVLGTYYLRPNSLALGAHVANAGYVVAEHYRRQGIGSRLCQHSLQAARRLGFRAMQFNLVVSTNTASIGCWQRNGFQVVGTLPGAFRHKQLGYVDALVMIQSLVEGPSP